MGELVAREADRRRVRVAKSFLLDETGPCVRLLDRRREGLTFGIVARRIVLNPTVVCVCLMIAISGIKPCFQKLLLTPLHGFAFLPPRLNVLKQGVSPRRNVHLRRLGLRVGR